MKNTVTLARRSQNLFTNQYKNLNEMYNSLFLNIPH